MDAEAERMAQAFLAELGEDDDGEFLGDAFELAG
jgi:hypothetical protein